MERFSKREWQLISALVSGKTQAEFASEHGLDRTTVGEFARRIRDKMGARTLVQAIYFVSLILEK